MYSTNTITHVRIGPGGIARPPPLRDALFKVSCALSYSDFLDALEMFTEALVPHQSRLAVTGMVDFKRGNLAGMLGRFFNVPAPGGAFVDMDMRVALAQKQRRMFATHPEVPVWCHLNEFPAFGARSSQEIHRTEYFRRVAEPELWCDSMYVPFWVDGNIHSSFWIKRGAGESPFSESEMEAMARYLPWLKAAFVRVHLLENERARAADIASGLFDIPVATVLLDWNLRLVMSNAAAEHSCAAWQLGLQRARSIKTSHLCSARIPAEIRAACADLREDWLAADAMRREYRRVVTHPLYPQLEATVTMLRPHSLRLGRPSFLVRVSSLETTPDGAPVANRMQLLTCLTQAERSVVPLVARGLSDKEIASALGKSVPTVKKQLRSIYEKLRIQGRGRLIALMR